MQKQDYLTQFHNNRQQWDTLLVEAGESRMTIPGVAGMWTFKDLIAHLTGWHKLSLARVRAGCGHPLRESLPWPAELDDGNVADVEPINQFIYAANRDRLLQNILDESRLVLDQLEDALADLPDAAFEDPDCFGWLEGQTLGEANLFSHLHDEHAADIAAWLEKLRLYA